MKKLAILKILAILTLAVLTTIPIIQLLSFRQIDTVEIVRPVNAVRTIPVGAYYYLWYGYNFTSHSWTGGDGTYHWNHDNDVIVDRPIIGYYASLNNETIKWQIDHMKASGLSFAIVSWWGWGIRNFSEPTIIEEGYQAINNATINLFNYLKDSGTTFKIAIMVEPFNIGEMDYTQVYNYIWNTFYSQYGPWIFEWQGKPLLAWFNPLSPPSNSSFTNRIVGNPPNNVDWVFWKGMDALDSYGGNAEPQYYIGNPIISYDGVVCITPRYDDYYFYNAGGRSGYMTFDKYYSKGLYAKEWDYVISNRDSINLVIIASWNEYHERNAIEPHIDIAGINQYYLTNATLYYNNYLQTTPDPQEWLNFGLSLYNPVLIAVGVITAITIVTYGIKRLID